MNKEYRDLFFDQGYISNIKIFEKDFIDKIFNNYLDYINNNSSRQKLVEVKTKTHLFFPWANQIIFEKKILDHVENIIGKNILCWNSLIFHKYPLSNNFVSMHQDQNYWNIKMNKAITVSLALTDSKISNGCLKIIPFSHNDKYEHVDLNDNANMLARGQTINFNNKNILDKAKNIELEKGECCIFHGNIAHGSLKNNSPNHRVLYAMRFLTPDNQINTSLYYNYATLVRGENNLNNFINEPLLKETSIGELRKLHEKIIISQFSKYLKLKIKINLLVKFFMFFLKNNYLRNILYKIIKKS